MSEETIRFMVAPFDLDDAETWVSQIPAPDATMPPFNPELAAPSPVDASRLAEQQAPDLDDAID
eukprot:8662706-Lingulodinium_polyedra.AAC.1